MKSMVCEGDSPTVWHCAARQVWIYFLHVITRWLSCPSCLLRVEDSHPTRVRPQRTLSFEGNHLAPLFQLKFVGNHVHLGLLQWSWMWVNYKRWATSRLSLAFGQVCWMSLFWSGLYIYDYICIISLSRETQEEVTRGLGAPPKSATKTRLR